MSDNLARALAEHVCSTNFDAFPRETIHKAKLHILDTLGAGIAGSASGETRTMLETLGIHDATGRSPIWGRLISADARTAALVNGVSAHAFELDDSGGCDHSGAVVLPAVLATLGDYNQPFSGRELLRSVLLGYEVGRRVLEAVGGYEEHNGLGWHSTGTCGAFGAAAAVGTMLTLDAEAMTSALGTACSFAGGTWAFIHNGSSTKKLHAGRAAEGGLMAAYLAKRGFEGPESVFEAERWGSFFATFGAGRGDPRALVRDFGQYWRLNRCSIKPHATCRGTHAGIDALDLLLQRHGREPADIAAMEVDISGFQYGMCGGKIIESRAQAQMSLPYALAARLRYGKVFLAELEEVAWSAAEIGPLMDRISVRIDPAMKDEDEPAITIVTTAGDRHRLVVDLPLGGPQNPLSDERLIGKYAALAGTVLPTARVDALRDFVLDLENKADARSLLALVQ
ncbi:MmgE/PrpD family protein [Rhizobium leucaenae]|uniref:2-methylcitrate dehydratase PrpD n=1 Tax=Rhizobium leucaenae TaxID=29450 RepID=A0A7W6ZVK1_9HYPH|nr:MmgE/PrpD family protein [Rhizobium leucaenae]MBB4568948.1 2-methylcitrate dehydratase PrpD [Rhizobium leucaenae]MBB6302680.1 2-methylcitrate dehydratase PrpD [Rhizobium leucaenae]